MTRCTSRFLPRTQTSALGLAVAIFCAGFSASCADSSDTSTNAAPAPQTPPPNTAPAPTDSSPLQPLSSRDGRAQQAAGSEISASGATFTLPSEWESQPPSSSMRLGQAVIPGAAGDAQLTAFHFGVGGGGGLESNIQRWLGQVEPDPGTQATRESFAVGEFQVTWIETQGTLKPSSMGTGPTAPQAGSRLLGGVVEGPGGPWFFKATGPGQTLDDARDGFLATLRSVRSAN